MAESTDKKTRKIAEKRVEPGKEFEGYQEAQNQLLAIQAEQQQNLALQANDAMNVQQQNQTLAQASEVMAMDNLNPATQGILAGYGLNQPRVIKQSNTQRQGPNNITINNTTINNASGPVQGREISIRPQEAGQSKFKAWLTNVFARQDAQWQKQNQEYSRRESSLTRNANKMMRKLEGLGKEIGNVVDPRKQAQRAQNSTMNLLKALGLVYFAKKLPNILGFFNNAEEKIRGWIGEIGDKIKGVFENSGDFFKDIGDKFWNDRETGYLNLFLQKITDFLSERANYATRVVGPIKAFDLDNTMKWIRLFLGGPVGGVRILKSKINAELFNDKEVIGNSNDFSFVDSHTQRSINTSFNEKKGFEFKDDNMYGLSSLKGGPLSAKNLNEEYKKWVNDNGKEVNDTTAREFIDSKEYVYTGESIILWEEVYKSTKHVLNKEYDLFSGRLVTNSIYAPIAASHDLMAEIKKGYKTYGAGTISFKDNNNRLTGSETTRQNSSIRAVLYYLDLLYHRATFGGSVVFEEAFKSVTSETLRNKLIKSGDAKQVTIIIVKQPMDEWDIKRYGGGSRGISKYYKKLQRTDHGDVDINKALPLGRKDFTGNSNYQVKQWTAFYSLSKEALGEIIEELTGSGIDEIYSKQSQIQAGTNIHKYGVFRSTGEDYHYRFMTNEDLEKAIEEKHYYELEKAALKEQKSNSEPVSSDGFLQYEGIKPNNIGNKNEDFNKRRDKVVDYLTSTLGLDKSVAIGIAGVLYNESRLNPAAVNRQKDGKPTVGGGQGLAQWTTGRQESFKKWYKNVKGKDLPDSGEENVSGLVKVPLEEQLEFMGYELKNGKYKPVLDKLKDVSSNKNLSDYDKLYRGTYIWTKDYEGGGTSEDKWHETFSHIDKDGKKVPHYFEDSFRQRFGTSLGLYEDIMGKQPEKREEPTSTSADPDIKSSPTPNSSPNNPTNASDNGNYRPNGTTGVDISLDQTSEAIVPDSITPVETETTESFISQPQSLAMAENMTPAERENRSPENNNEILLARCAEGIDYIAKTMAPLSEVINSGNMMVAEAVSKSGGPTNLTPQEPQLEMNRV